jgi:hypothetical protein
MAVLSNRGPTTYVELYDTVPDLLVDDYSPLYARHAVANAVSSDVLLTQAIQASQTVPKVYLCLVKAGGR